ncbi:MAG: hypothetical protein LC768_13880 [Acidobacteria bacterium]|nr:hypothetical protein [Acidobacteriota bacterium]MCA1639401.1 hypothetical protein [Acidobacteriota bacterium]
MNTKNTTRTFVIALAMMLALAIVPTMGFGQIRVLNPPQEEQGNDLVGVWESVAPVTTDCQTGEQMGPTIRALYNFTQGGTMMEENTDPIEGPYRNTGHGIWKRTLGRNYNALYLHYGYLPDKTHVVIVKVRSNITLSRGLNSFTQNGTFEVLDSNNNPLLDPDGNPIRGCFRDTATRLTF